jgi:hypothetical protein
MHVAFLGNQFKILEYLLQETEAKDKDFDPLMMASVYENYGANNCLHICAM